MCVLRLSLNHRTGEVIICICRGASEKQIDKSIAGGASTLRDLQRCGIGDQCGSCHNALRGMLARASVAGQSCPACNAAPEPATVSLMA